MPAQDEPIGTLGHAKEMASAVYAYESSGPTSTRSTISRSTCAVPNHSAAPYDESGKVKDTLGCNDIAEALVWASATIRYAETMYARKLRKRLGLE